MCALGREGSAEGDQDRVLRLPPGVRRRGDGLAGAAQRVRLRLPRQGVRLPPEPGLPAARVQVHVQEHQQRAHLQQQARPAPLGPGQVPLRLQEQDGVFNWDGVRPKGVQVQKHPELCILEISTRFFFPKYQGAREG